MALVTRKQVGLKPTASAGGRNITVLAAGTPVTVDPTWAKVATADGLVGWVHAADLAPAPIIVPGPVAPSGIAMPVGDLPGWRQIFTEDFTTNVAVGSFPGPAYAAKWSAYPDGWLDTSKHGTYMPSTVLSVAGGALNLYLHTDSQGRHCVSAPLPILSPGAKAYGADWTYGKLEWCMRSDRLPGYKTANLLWPANDGDWPAAGEMDHPEGNLDSGTIEAFMHWWGGGGQDAYSATCDRTAYHRFGIEWLPGSLTFLLDGVIIGHATAKVPSGPMHFVLQCETALDGSTPDSTVAGLIQVDWFVAYIPA